MTSDQAKVPTIYAAQKQFARTKIVLSMTEATNPPTFHQPVAVTLGPISLPRAFLGLREYLSRKPGWQPIAIVTFAA